MKNNINTDIWLSRIGLVLIFCYCFLVSIFFSYFAQMHLSLSFLPFPIFVGEILMFVCLLLMGSVCENSSPFSRRSALLLGAYFGWVMLRALINYHYDGPLSARNAALFYYPIFAVFSYVFYQKAKFPRNILMSLAFLAAGILLFKEMIVWYWWTYVTVLVIAVWNAKSLKWRWAGWVLLAAIFWLGREYFYQGARAHLVSVLCVLVFLGLYFGMLFARRRHYVLLGILLVSFLFFILGYFIYAEHNAVSSLTSFKKMMDKYDECDKLYQSRLAKYVPKNLPIHLYNPKKLEDIFPTAAVFIAQPPATVRPATPNLEVSHPVTTSVEASHPATPSMEVPHPAIPNAEASHVATPNVEVSRPVTPSVEVSHPATTDVETHQTSVYGDAVPTSMSKLTLDSRIVQHRSLEVDEGNIVFRLFIWRDMARELIENKAWWGFSFGHPQRSRSLEVLCWGQTEWQRDGWVMPHNSYFHIIYRAGILGVFLIVVLFFLIARLTKDFFNLNSVEGAFLVGALVYWLVLSNFFVILEFPYNAIVFWTLFGITCAYRDELKKKPYEE